MVLAFIDLLNPANLNKHGDSVIKEGGLLKVELTIVNGTTGLNGDASIVFHVIDGGVLAHRRLKDLQRYRWQDGVIWLPVDERDSECIGSGPNKKCRGRFLSDPLEH